MAINHTNLFSILNEVLSESNLSEKSLPSDMDQWHKFILQINSYLSDLKNENDSLKYTLKELNQRSEVENQKIITLSRQVGMSEVASFILHNIGNILNSVNVSIALIDELIRNSEIKNLEKISKMINENIPIKVDYLVSDDKGKLIPTYLSFLSKNLQTEHNEINNEVMSLKKNISHIKNIVVMQKDISGISGVSEKVALTEICDLAIQMVCSSFEKYEIKIIKKYHCNDIISINKSKLLQILVNLIRNAKEALILQPNKHMKKIIVTTMRSKPNIEISVEDNGIGISKKHISQIFSMGFTTKQDGHGFGLYSSALAANELGGTLNIKQAIENKGAIFALVLPEVVAYGKSNE